MGEAFLLFHDKKVEDNKVDGVDMRSSFVLTLLFAQLGAAPPLLLLHFFSFTSFHPLPPPTFFSLLFHSLLLLRFESLEAFPSGFDYFFVLFGCWVVEFFEGSLAEVWPEFSSVWNSNCDSLRILRTFWFQWGSFMSWLFEDDFVFSNSFIMFWEGN